MGYLISAHIVKNKPEVGKLTALHNALTKLQLANGLSRIRGVEVVHWWRRSRNAGSRDFRSGV